MRYFILILCYAILALPLGYFLNIKERTVINGAENIANKPKFTIQTFYSKEFQKNFEAWWKHNFLFRKAMLKTTNQLYEWINFKQFHLGYGKNIIQGNDNNLLELSYLRTAYIEKYNDISLNNTRIIAKKIQFIQNRLNKIGIKFLFLMAPSKVRTLPQAVPQRFIFFKNKSNIGNGYSILSEELKRQNVNFFNAQQLMEVIEKENEYDAFPYSGTHWTGYAVARTIQETLPLLGIKKIDIKEVSLVTKPTFVERDLADLLNLWFEFRDDDQKYPKVIFTKEKPFLETIGLIGDSFTTDYRKKMIESGVFDKDHVIYFENSIFTKNDLKRMFDKTTIFVFVFTEPNFFNGTLANKVNVVYKFLLNHKIRDT